MKETQPSVRSALALALLPVAIASAHFQALLPDTEIAGPDHRTVSFDIRFTHPMEQGPLMNMGEPALFGVLVQGHQDDVKGELTRQETGGMATYTGTVRLQRPGDHVFFLEPAPYWEPAEGKMIVHYTKVVVNAFGMEEGWDAMVGLPVEIEPLVRPYGLWTGNTFRGIVRRNGKPVPFAEVEVEYWNHGEAVKPPAGPFVTQVIKADANGMFAYTMPRAGWWGFAALVEGEKPMKNPAGKPVPVELGGLIWIRCRDMR